MSSGHYCDDCAQAYYNCVCISVSHIASPQQLGYLAFWRQWGEDVIQENPFAVCTNDYGEWEYGWSLALQDKAAGEEENG